jgi:hypothetical protein
MAETDWKETLASIIEAVGEVGGFACSGGDWDGDVIEPLPELSVTGVGQLRLPLQNDQAAALLATGEAAPYGKGPHTVLDPSVRRATQLDASHVRANSDWETTLQDITAGARSYRGNKNTSESLFSC